jgi:AraC family transcriptional regulator, regulatory protein of adaptative response / methylated-DNA-[protein]-cysteine methyltransferase
MRDVISYIRKNARQRPSVADMAKIAGMSVSRFEHVFAEWVGTSPKRLLAHLNKEEAKFHLARSKDVLKTAHAAGLSGPGRLHGLMVTHEAVSPGEFKSGGIEIEYGIHSSPFGWCLIGVTKRGVCHLSFLNNNDKNLGIKIIQNNWPNSKLVQNQDLTGEYIRRIFSVNKKSKQPIHLLIKGTNFQIKVWEALLKIPEGKIMSYSQVAKMTGFPKAIRAVGTACGRNSIAYLIPCHRVLTSDGKIGGYRWGVKRKQAILALESLR